MTRGSSSCEAVRLRREEGQVSRFPGGMGGVETFFVLAWNEDGQNLDWWRRIRDAMKHSGFLSINPGGEGMDTLLIIIFVRFGEVGSVTVGRRDSPKKKKKFWQITDSSSRRPMLRLRVGG